MIEQMKRGKMRTTLNEVIFLLLLSYGLIAFDMEYVYSHNSDFSSEGKIEHLLIQIGDGFDPITVGIIHKKKHFQSILDSPGVNIEVQGSKEFRTPVYLLPDGRVLVELKRPMQYAYLLSSLSDYRLIQERVLIFKLSLGKDAFYAVKYFGKERILEIITENQGTEMPRYCGRNEKVFQLSNGKIMHVEFVKYGNNDFSHATLYSSKEEVEQLFILDHVLERISNE